MKLASGRPMADINVTPFVDVVLVLLVIFMLTAPLMIGGVKVDLPRTAAAGVDLREELTVTVTREGKIYIADTEIPRAAFRRTMEDAVRQTQRPRAYLRADQGVPYGQVVDVLGIMREAGIENVGLVTHPGTEWKPGEERRRR